MKRKGAALLSCLVFVITCVGLTGWGTTNPTDNPDVRAGAAIYKKHCLRCHGNQGKGDGPATKILKTKPHDFTDKQFMAQISDEELLKVITGGGPAVGKSKLMPPYGKKLKQEELRAVVAFLRSLAKG